MDSQLDNCIRKYQDVLCKMLFKLADLLAISKDSPQYQLYLPIYTCILTHDSDISKLYKITQTSVRDKQTIQKEIKQLNRDIKQLEEDFQEIQDDMEYRQARLACLEEDLQEFE